MSFKISTKEKFHELQVLEHQLTANVAGEIENACNDLLQGPVKNVILQMTEVTALDAIGAEKIVLLQQRFYEHGVSFIVCELTPDVEAQLDELSLLETLNPIPTLSEAWDMVQMEEIERDLLSE
jgi:anti-anti-sigma regulatory factor